MSRFDGGLYATLLASPPDGRKALQSCGEKRLWSLRHRPFPLLFLTTFLFLAAMMPIVPILGIGTGLVSSATGGRIVAADIGLFLVMIVIGFVYFLYLPEHRYKKYRPPVSLEDFVAASQSLSGVDRKYVDAVRETLGFAYTCDAEVIVPGDTGDSLAPFTYDVQEPLAFEVVVGTAIRLNITLSEQAVDEAVDHIRRHCRTVDDLVIALVDRLTLARQQVD